MFAERVALRSISVIVSLAALLGRVLPQRGATEVGPRRGHLDASHKSYRACCSLTQRLQRFFDGPFYCEEICIPVSACVGDKLACQEIDKEARLMDITFGRSTTPTTVFQKSMRWSGNPARRQNLIINGALPIVKQQSRHNQRDVNQHTHCTLAL